MYLLQQEDPLGVFGQVVRGKAALDACSNHNSIPEICLSSHDATKPTEKADKGHLQARRGGERQSPAKLEFPQSLGAHVLVFLSLPQKAWHRAQPPPPPAEQSWVD